MPLGAEWDEDWPKRKLVGSPAGRVIHRMLPDTFTPFQIATAARARGCLVCTHFHGRFYADHLLCERDNGRQVIGVPAMDCAFWQREPGANDV